MRTRHATAALAGLSFFLLLCACGSTEKSGAPEGAAPASTPLSLRSEIEAVTVGSQTVVTFTLSDPNGVPLEPTGSSTPGPGQARARFTIARIQADGNYRNYIKSSTAGQPGYDSGGTFAALGSGRYTYTFKTNLDNASQTLGGIVLTGNLDRTHTVAAQIQRTVTDNTTLVPANREFVQAANPYLNVRPDNGAVTVTREVVSLSACNACHGLLGLHGGARREIVLCILCHNPGVVDPETGNSVDMKSLIHRIHMGAKLPSHDNAAFGRTDNTTGDYTIVGNSGNVHSYRTVAYPYFSTDNTVTRTPADCRQCHKAGTDLAGRPFGRDVDAFKANPTINKCTTCHNLTSFTSPAGDYIDNNGTTVVAIPRFTHTTGAIDDPTGDNAALCVGCHAPGVEGTNEYDNTVVGAHTIAEKSSRNPGVHFEILAVDNATAGNSPGVKFRVTLDNGSAVVLSATSNVTNFSLRMGYIPAGSVDFANDRLFDNTTPTRPGQPTSFSLTGSSSAIARLINHGDGSYTALLAADNDVIPAGIAGTGVISMEGRLGLIGSIATPHKGTRTNSSIRFSGPASQWFFDLTTGARVTDPGLTRRVVAITAKCNVCHSIVRLHGGSRINVEECVICHNPNAVAADNTTPIHFKFMIHKIHSGENLTRPYVIGGANFNEVRYPRDRRDCLACHADETPPVFGLPLRFGVLPTTVEMGAIQNDSADDTKIGPIRAVCATCHDDATTTEPHILGETVFGAGQPSWGTELCVSCHRTGLTFGPDQVHRPGRPGTFPVE